jgi:3-phenylpropionate/cinnamic acid dioxygenase small subunit
MPPKMAEISPELFFEVQTFLIREASLLDEGRFDEWLDLLTDDSRYIMPVRRTVESRPTAPIETGDEAVFSLFDDDKPSLTTRIRRIETGLAHAEVPLSTVQRLISNIRLEPGTNSSELVAHSSFFIYQERRGRNATTFIGKRRDRLRRENGMWKIAHRYIQLAQAILPATISILF